MKANRRAIGWLVILMAAAMTLMVSGCGGDDDNDNADNAGGGAVVPGGDDTAGTDDTAAGNVNIAGVWNGTRSSDAGSARLQFYFEQAGGTLSGDYHDTSGYEGHFTGTIDGDDIQLTLVLTAGAPGAVWTFAGAANATGTNLSGQMNTGAATDTIVATR